MKTKKQQTSRRSTSAARKEGGTNRSSKRTATRTAGDKVVAAPTRVGSKLTVVVGKPTSLSAYGRAATKAFHRGVQAQLADLARKRIPTIAEIDGHIVRAVPKRVRGQFVLQEDGRHSRRSHASRRTGK